MTITPTIIPVETGRPTTNLTWGEAMTCEVSSDPALPPGTSFSIFLVRDGRPETWLATATVLPIVFDIPLVRGPCKFRVSAWSDAETVSVLSEQHVIGPPAGEAGLQNAQMRAYLKWFIGDGVPQYNNGFQVRPLDPAANDDFMIAGGHAPPGTAAEEVALYYTGRIQADGLEATITSNIPFRQQRLHVSQPDAAALAAAWGVPTIPELPQGKRPVSIYIDVWERALAPGEAPPSVRSRHEWAVRWRYLHKGERPRPGDVDWQTGHGYYPLARLTPHKASAGAITAEDIVDVRETRGIRLPKTIVEDIYGKPEPWLPSFPGFPMGLRDAINAGIAGELPMSDDRPVVPADVHQFWRGAVCAGPNRIVTYVGMGKAGDIVVHDLDMIDGHVSSYTVAAAAPGLSVHGTVLPDGDSVVLYISEKASTATVSYKRGAPAALPDAAAQVVTTTADPDAPVLVVPCRDVLTFLWRDLPTGHLMGRRLRYTDGAWMDVLDVSGAVVDAGRVHAISDSAGKAVWCAYSIGGNPVVRYFEPFHGRPSVPTGSLGEGCSDAFLFDGPDYGMRVFYSQKRQPGLVQSAWYPDGWVPERIPSTEGAAPAGLGGGQPCVLGTKAGLWLLFREALSAQSTRILASYFSRKTMTWGPPRVIVGSPGIHVEPVVVGGPRGEAYLFWLRTPSELANTRLWWKVFLTRL